MDDVVGVLGAGVMGAGVAEATAEAGYRVVLVDVSQDALDTARSAIRRSRAARLLLSGGDRSDVLERIATSTDYRRLRDAHVVVENVTEDVAVKRAAHRRIDELCRGDALVAANTSAIPIAVLAKGTGHPERVVGTDPRHLPPRGERALCARCCVPSMRQEIGLLFPVRSTGPHRRCRSGRWSRRFPEIAAAAAELGDRR
jgi:NAD(P)-dependent dehydrogenase (short-subunit alcohol dehydrogenase family)